MKCVIGPLSAKKIRQPNMCRDYVLGRSGRCCGEGHMEGVEVEGRSRRYAACSLTFYLAQTLLYAFLNQAHENPTHALHCPAPVHVKYRGALRTTDVPVTKLYLKILRTWVQQARLVCIKAASALLVNPFSQMYDG